MSSLIYIVVFSILLMCGDCCRLSHEESRAMGKWAKQELGRAVDWFKLVIGADACCNGRVLRTSHGCGRFQSPIGNFRKWSTLSRSIKPCCCYSICRGRRRRRQHFIRRTGNETDRGACFWWRRSLLPYETSVVVQKRGVSRTGVVGVDKVGICVSLVDGALDGWLYRFRQLW
jgi:hypothetical protein